MSFGDLQRLRAFALVLDLGSISAAASVLGYTQSAVSQQLAALEREVGSALVDRSQRPLRATRAGAMLRPHVERVLAALGGAEAARGGPARRHAPPAPGRLPQRPVVVRAGGGARPAPHAPGARRPGPPARDRTRRSSASAPATPTSRWCTTCPGSAVPETAGLQRRRAARRPPLRGAARGPPARAARRREHRRPGGRAADPAAARHARRALPLGGRAPLRAGRLRPARGLRARRSAGGAGIRRRGDRRRARCTG